MADEVRVFCVICPQTIMLPIIGLIIGRILVRSVKVPASTWRRIVAWVRTKQPTWAKDAKRSTEQDISLQEAFILESSQGSSTLRLVDFIIFPFAAHQFSGVTECQVELYLFCRLPMTK